MAYIRRLTGYALRHKGLFLGFLACAGIGTLFNILSPIVLVNIIDVVIYQGQYDQLASNVTIYISLMALYAFFDIAGRYGAAITSQKVIYDLRKELYDSLMQKDLSFYDQEETGQLLSRVTTDVNQMKRFLFWGYRIIFIGFATLVGVYFVMYTLSITLTMFMLLLVPIIISFVYVFARKVRPVFIAARDQFGDLSSVLSENVVGMKVVKSYAAGDRESERVRKENEDFLHLRVEAFKLFAFYRPLLPTMFGLVTGFLIYIGGFSFSLGGLSYGVFVGFVSLVAMLILPARFLSWGVDVYQRASAAAERSFYILDHKDEVLNPDDPIEKDIEGKIEFDNVYFSYGLDTFILKGISMRVDPGKVVALLGGTGSGKTTLMNLIPRFYDADDRPNVEYKGELFKATPDGMIKIANKEYEIENGTATIEGEELNVVQPGRLYVDGEDVCRYDLNVLRGSIGMVHQDPFLFSATIRENIAFAKPDAHLEEVIDAAKAAMIHDFIETLDEGYDAPVGERGVTLSGGQKQRIAIARALLADPRILILDDSTSSVDANTEMKIQKALENLMVGRTTFIITHRLSTVRNADLIVMLERGEIVEKGTHEELMEKDGLYAGIHDTLFEMELAASTIEGGASNE